MTDGTAFASSGMVCAVDHLASSAGVEILRCGGNAADAAIATSAVLTVTTQHMCGLGGDLFALVSRDGQEPLALDASGRAGSGADPDRLRHEGHTQMPFHDDIRSTPVPGCVDGWLALHQRLGRLPLADVLAPAIGYAGNGFPAAPSLAAAVTRLVDRPGAEQFRPDDRPLDAGAIVRRPGIARALRAVVAHGRNGFYGGDFGAGLLALGEGEYAEADLATPQADWVTPLRLDAFGRTLFTMPPSSQGYLTLAGAWIADQVGLPADPDDPQWAHLTIEAARAAAYDRVEVLHEQADGRALIGPDRLAGRAARVDPRRATDWGGSYGLGGTIHLTVVDREGCGVSLTQSNAAGFGSLVVEPATGIFLQNRGVGFSLQPGHPAEYGPRRRPPHTLAPALVTTTDLRLDTVLGTMGGDAQPQILLQLLARLLVNDQSAGAAVGAARWGLASSAGGGFDTWAERGRVQVLLEDGVPKTWADELAARGHDVQARPAGSGFGHAHVIRVRDGRLEGASDPRAGSGAAVGY
jgi:gamma-glutamyltranspeptidase/glutathione hydrolase